MAAMMVLSDARTLGSLPPQESGDSQGTRAGDPACLEANEGVKETKPTLNE